MRLCTNTGWWLGISLTVRNTYNQVRGLFAVTPKVYKVLFLAFLATKEMGHGWLPSTRKVTSLPTNTDTLGFNKLLFGNV